MRHVIKSTSRLAIAVVCFAAAGSASAAITLGTGVTATTQSLDWNGGVTAYSGDVSSSDLLNGLTPTFDGNWFTTSGRTPANLVDGLHGAASDAGSLAQTEAPPAVVVFNLGTGDNGTGYDLTSLVSIAAWGGNVGYGNQVWTLEVAGVGADGSLESADFTTLLSAVNTQLGSTQNGSTKVTVAGLSGSLTTGVQYIRFTGKPTGKSANNRTAYRELDIQGVSTAVPEPSAIVLIALAGLTFVLRRQR